MRLFLSFFLVFTYNRISLRYLCILTAIYFHPIKKGLSNINNYGFGKAWLIFAKFARHIYQVLGGLDKRFGNLNCD
jgi:hypothetical protein